MAEEKLSPEQAKALVAAGFNLLLRSTLEELATNWRATLWAGMKLVAPEPNIIGLYENSLGRARMNALEGRPQEEEDVAPSPP